MRCIRFYLTLGLELVHAGERKLKDLLLNIFGLKVLSLYQLKIVMQENKERNNFEKRFKECDEKFNTIF